MNVQQLREAIADIPGHWPVVIERHVPSVDPLAEGRVDYVDAVDVQIAGAKGQGNLVAVLPPRPWDRV